MKRPAAFVEEEVQVSWWPAFEGRLVAWIDADCPTVSLPDGESAGSESASSSAASLGTVQRKVLVGKVRDHIVRSCLAQFKIHGSRVLGKNARYQKLFSTLPQDDENLFLGLTPRAGCAVWAQTWEREDLIAFASSYHDSMLGLC